MAELTTPHDKLFRYIFGQPEQAADLLRHYLPAEVAALLDVDPERMKRRPETFVDDELATHAADLVFEVPLRDGGMVTALVLFEHKSRPEAAVAFQLLRYMVRLWEADQRAGRRLLPVIPMVVYHGRQRCG